MFPLPSAHTRHISYYLQECTWEESKKWESVRQNTIPLISLHSVLIWLKMIYVSKLLFHSSRLWERITSHMSQLITLAEEKKSMAKCPLRVPHTPCCCEVINDFIDKLNSKNGTNTCNHDKGICQWIVCYKKSLMSHAMLIISISMHAFSFL